MDFVKVWAHYMVCMLTRNAIIHELIQLSKRAIHRSDMHAPGWFDVE